MRSDRFRWISPYSFLPPRRFASLGAWPSRVQAESCADGGAKSDCGMLKGSVVKGSLYSSRLCRRNSADLHRCSGVPAVGIPCMLLWGSTGT